MKKKFFLVLFLTLGIAFAGATSVASNLFVSTEIVKADSSYKIVLKSDAEAPSNIFIGSTYALKVKGTSVDCKYYSSNKKIAYVGLGTGKLKPLIPGTVKITAKNPATGKIMASKTFDVLQRSSYIEVTDSKGKDLSEITLNVGETYTPKVIKSPANSTDVLSFLSENKSIAKVGGTSGLITAVSVGQTTIKVYSKVTYQTANSNSGNKLDTLIVNVTNSSITEYKKVTVKESEGGTITVPKAEYPVGETIKLKVVADPKHVFKSITTNVSSCKPVYKDGAISFAMPDKDLELSPVFDFDKEYVYSMTYSTNDALMGSIKADKYSGKPGTKVVVTASPNTGYKLLSWMVDGVSSPKGSNNQYTYTIGNKDGKVKAIFAPSSSDVPPEEEVIKRTLYTFDKDEYTGVEAATNYLSGSSSRSYNVGEQVTIQFDNKGGTKKFIRWEFYSDSDGEIVDGNIVIGNKLTESIKLEVSDYNVKIVAIYENNTTTYKLTYACGLDEKDLYTVYLPEGFFDCISSLEPDLGWQFDHWEYETTVGSFVPEYGAYDKDFYYRMPAADLYVKAVYNKLPGVQRKINLEDCKFLYNNQAPSAEVGDVVWFYADASKVAADNTADDFIEYIILDNDGNQHPELISDKTQISNSINMPDYDITIIANYGPKERTITIEDTEHGTVKLADSSQAFIDKEDGKLKAYTADTVLFELVPDDGYIANGLSFNGAFPPAYGSNWFEVGYTDIKVKPLFTAITGDKHPLISQVEGQGLFFIDADPNPTDNATYGIAGDIMHLRPIPKEGYKFDGYEVIKGEVNIVNDSFEMPDEAVSIKAKFVKEEFDIEVLSDGNGVVIPNVTKAGIGDQITLSINPNPGFELYFLDYLLSGISIVDNEFDMPAKNVKIKAYFRPSNHPITVNSSEGGTANADLETASYGNIITLSQTAQEGFHFVEWKVISGNITIKDNQFEQGTEDVVIEAVFAKNEPHISPSSGLSGGAIAGIVIGSVVVLVTGLYFGLGYPLYKKGKITGKFLVKIYKWSKKDK